MPRTPRRLALPLLLPLFLGSCAFHSTARSWNERVGPDGEEVFFKSTTKVGLNFLVVLPFLGDTGITGMVDDLTEDVAGEGGDHVRIVQGDSENYWYGFPPFTWIVTPVISTLAAEYRPSEEALRRREEERAAKEAKRAAHEADSEEPEEE